MRQLYNFILSKKNLNYNTYTNVHYSDNQLHKHKKKILHAKIIGNTQFIPTSAYIYIYTHNYVILQDTYREMGKKLQENEICK